MSSKKTYFLILIVLILADQLTKWFVFKGFLVGFVSGLISFVSCNPFIAWGIPLAGFWFWVFWILSIIFLISFFRKNSSFFLVMILAGAIGNIIDRIHLGCVIDFIQVGNFPTFNLADSFITIGVALFVWSELLKNKKT